MPFCGGDHQGAGIDFVPAAVQLLCRVHLGDLGVESSTVPRACVQHVPEFWRLELGTGDLADVYRHCPAADVDLGASVVAAWVSERRTVSGCTFCLDSTVLVCSHTLALAVATSRRVCDSVTSHHFDDFQSTGSAHHRSASQSAIRSVLEAMGSRR